jgi:integrase
MHERTRIELSRADRAELEAVIANRNSPQKHVWRAKIVLLTADDHGTAEIMRRTGKAKTVIWRWQERFGAEGLGALWRDKTRPSRIPPLGPARLLGSRSSFHSHMLRHSCGYKLANDCHDTRAIQHYLGHRSGADRPPESGRVGKRKGRYA